MPGQNVTRTILVTGGTGNLGRAVTERLLGEGHQIAVTWLVEKEKRRAEELESDNLMLVHADVTDATRSDERSKRSNDTSLA
jgi:NAD(P)-dependent dehydrogenase (short-subunit alcohol dehydrogenase family)